MHGSELSTPERRTLRLSAPRKPFSPAPGLTLSSAPQLHSPERDRTLVTTFRSPATAAAFTASIPGSKFPACNFAFPPTVSATRSAFQLDNLDRFAPIPAASPLLARCRFPGWLKRLLPRSPLPFRTLTSLRIKAFNRIRYRSARLPTPPDLLSLPVAQSITSFGSGSPLLVRYVFGGLLFLKPLGTFLTMRLLTFPVNALMLSKVHFQQVLFSVFSGSYRSVTVYRLWIKRISGLLFLRATRDNR